jgi:hypothetical protein
MKQVVYTDRAKQDPKDYAALQAVTNVLDNVSTPSRDIVTAEWDKTTDPHGGPAYVLRLSDWSGSASQVFGPTDLDPSNIYLRSRLFSLWDRVLANRTHRLLDDIRRSNEEENGRG